jgi:hypothetical protein
MPDAGCFRKLARRCRALARGAFVPEVKEQLRLWAVECADRADEAERRAPERERAEAPFRRASRSASV